jgi:hypothetical protein
MAVVIDYCSWNLRSEGASRDHHFKGKGKKGHRRSCSKKDVKDQGERTGAWYPTVYTTEELK